MRDTVTCARARDHTTPGPSCKLVANSEDVPSGGAQGAVGDRSAPTRAANAAGVRYPKLLCGRSSLYSFRHGSILLRPWSEPLKWHSEIGHSFRERKHREEKEILPEISANGRGADEDLRERHGTGPGARG